MTIDEAINDFKKMAENARNDIINGDNLEPQEKHYNSQLELYAKEKEQLAEWLEELKAYRETKPKEIPFATIKFSKEDMQELVNEKVKEIEIDIQAIRNKAIDECLGVLYRNAGKIISIRFYEQIYNEIKQLKAGEAEEYNGGWIPADEPPETDAYVLLSFANFSMPMVGRYDEEETCGGAYYIGDEVVSCVSQDLFVNAWQPLPESYKERE